MVSDDKVAGHAGGGQGTASIRLDAEGRGAASGAGGEGVEHEGVTPPCLSDTLSFLAS